jgi:mannonate dehydratase
MRAFSRRDLLRGAIPAAATLVGSAPGETTAPAKRARMVLGCQRAPTDERALRFFKRHAVEHISGYPPPAEGREGWTASALSRLRELCDHHGVALDMVEFPFMASNPLDAGARKAIMLGREPDRQREIDEVCEIIRNCASAGIPAAKYNLNLLGVLRTAPTPGRGGSSYSTWRLSEASEEPPLTLAGKVSEDLAWERITYFLERVVPVATEHRVRLACHPHDPGVPPSGFRGVARVLGTVEGLRRFVSIKEGPYHGLNFCLGSVAEMLQDPGRELHGVIREFGARGKIFNIHYRNIRGRRDAFQEVFPDEGDVDMAKVMVTLKEVGYGYMVMPDHMPTHPDDPGQHQAFAFAYGYIKAMIQAVDALP